MLFVLRIALVDYFVIGEAAGIVATLFVSFYYSRKQMQKLSVDIETKVLSDLDEKITDLTEIAIEKSQLRKIVSNVDSNVRRNIIRVPSATYLIPQCDIGHISP